MKNATRCGWREGLGRVHFLGPFFGSVNAGAIPCEPSRQADFSRKPRKFQPFEKSGKKSEMLELMFSGVGAGSRSILSPRKE